MSDPACGKGQRTLPGRRATKTTRAYTCASIKRYDEESEGKAVANRTDDLDNPWLALPEAPEYVLADDLAILRRFPMAMDKLVFAGMPGPFVGNPLMARVLLLALHPGFVDSDAEAARDQAIQGPWRDTSASRRRPLPSDRAGPPSRRRLPLVAQEAAEGL